MTINTIPQFDPIYNVVVSMDESQDVLLVDPVNAFVSAAFTIEWWMKASAQNTGTLLSYTLTGEQSLMITDPGNINIYINTVQTTPTGISFSDDGDWHYFTVTWNNSDGRLLLYKDAVLVYTTVLAQLTTIQPGGSLAVGQKQASPGGGFSNPYAGKIGEFRIWDQVRPLSFIKQDMVRDIYGNGSLPVWQLLSPDTSFMNVSAGTGLVNNLPVTTLFGVSADPDNNVIKSDDLGQSWTLVPSPAMDYVCVQDAANIWGIGTDQNIYLSGDAGNTWKTPNATAKLVQLSAVSGAAMGVSANMLVYRSTDMGVTWKEPKAGTKMVNIAVADTETSWAVEQDGHLFRSADAGVSWQEIPVSFSALQVACSGGMVIVLSSTGVLNCSTDNGANWKTLLSDTPAAFFNVTVSGNTVWGINTANQLLLSMINTAMVVNWPLIEGYGCYGFDYSGNNNNGRLGSCTLEQDEQEWEVSTLITAPKFIDGPASVFIAAVGQVQRELEEAAHPKAVTVANAALPAAAARRKAAKPKRSAAKPKRVAAKPKRKK